MLRHFMREVDLLRSPFCKFARFMGGNLHIPWADATWYHSVKETEPPTE
jgi:hypothetical protein